MEAGRELDALVAEQVMGLDLSVPRERAMAIAGATYTRVTGSTFKLDVHGYDLSVRMPPGDTIPGHPSDDNFNQRYCRYLVAELLTYPNEIGELVARDVASIRATPQPYSTDLAAVWRVVEMMLARGFDVTTRARRPLPYSVVFEWDTPGGSHFTAEATADTMPLAVCRAALLATERAA